MCMGAYAWEEILEDIRTTTTLILALIDECKELTNDEAKGQGAACEHSSSLGRVSSTNRDQLSDLGD